MVEVWKVCMMPDHIHMIVRVNEDLPFGRHLEKVVAGFKLGCNRTYWRIYGMSKSPREGLFEAGYNVRILMRKGQLDNWKASLDDYPRCLMLKRRNPRFFRCFTIWKWLEGSVR